MQNLFTWTSILVGLTLFLPGRYWKTGSVYEYLLFSLVLHFGGDCCPICGVELFSNTVLPSSLLSAVFSSWRTSAFIGLLYVKNTLHLQNLINCVTKEVRGRKLVQRGERTKPRSTGELFTYSDYCWYYHTAILSRNNHLGKAVQGNCLTLILFLALINICSTFLGKNLGVVYSQYIYLVAIAIWGVTFANDSKQQHFNLVDLLV